MERRSHTEVPQKMKFEKENVYRGLLFVIGVPLVLIYRWYFHAFSISVQIWGDLYDYGRPPCGSSKILLTTLSSSEGNGSSAGSSLASGASELAAPSEWPAPAPAPSAPAPSEWPAPSAPAPSEWPE